MPSHRRPHAALTAVIGLLFVLTACSTSASPSGSAAAECTEPSNGVLTITAASLAFDTTCLALPAGEAVTIHLVNDDTEPHNVSIYTDDSRAMPLFTGEIIEGGETTDYDVPAQEAGTYYFQCDVHSGMNGSVVVE